MASPNIVGLGTILGFTTSLTLSSSNETVLLNAPADALNTVMKVNNIILANTTSTTVNATVTFRGNSGGGGTAFKLANSTPVPAYSTLVIIDKASAIYLEENRSITVTSSSASGLLDAVASYEVIR